MLNKESKNIFMKIIRTWLSIKEKKEEKNRNEPALKEYLDKWQIKKVSLIMKYEIRKLIVVDRIIVIVISTNNK